MGWQSMGTGIQGRFSIFPIPWSIHPSRTSRGHSRGYNGMEAMMEAIVKAMMEMVEATMEAAVVGVRVEMRGGGGCDGGGRD